MNIEFSEAVSVEDFRNAMCLHYRKRKWIIYLLWVAMMPVLFAPLMESIKSSLGFICVLAVSISGGVVFLEIFVPGLLYAAHYRRSSLMKRTFAVKVDEEWISFVSPDLENRYRWRAFKKYKEDQYVFILYPASTAFEIIPKRVLTESQIEELHHFLSETIDPRCRASSAELDAGKDSSI
jgi:hypothetical protein